MGKLRSSVYDSNRYRLLIENDTVKIERRKVDPYIFAATTKILWPSAFAESAWVYVSSYTRKYWSHITAKPLEKKQLQPPENNRELQVKESQHGGKTSPLPPVRTQTTNGAASGAAGSTSSKHPPEPKSLEVSKTADFLSKVGFSKIQNTEPNIRYSWGEFLRTFRNKWNRVKPYPPRGCIIVMGFVEVESQAAVAVLDVRGFWDPKISGFSPRTTHVGIRSITMKQQRPYV
jgi:hypothetical protein